MRFTTSIGAIVLASLLTACSGSRADMPGSASVSLNGATYLVRDVALVLETGEDPWFSIDGEPVTHADQDCVPGLSGGLSLYGDLPSSVTKPIDLVGKRLRVDFTGDGDEANFCFVGMGGLAGAEDAWVTIDSVSGNRVTFSMTGSFKVFDENGDGPIATASAKGTAVVGEKS